MKHKPPKIVVWLLSRLTIPENRYSLAGDAEEEYKAIAAENGIAIAYLWYWLQVFISIPPFTKHFIYWRITMFANYFKMALRNILKHKMYSAINIFGLSIGIAFCILIFLYTKNEMTFDSFHEKKDNIYRVLRVDKNEDGTVRRLRGGLPMIVGPTLTAEIAAIKSTVRFLSASSWVKTENYIANEGILFGDPAIFEIFSFKLLAENARNPLSDINSVVLSRREAEKIFGTAQAEGKTVAIKIENEFRDFTVTGVIENIPENSSIRFDILLNFYVIEHSSRYRDSADKWDHNNSSLFVLLKNNSSETGVKPAIDTFARAHLDNSPGLRLQRLTDLHLDDSVGANIELVTNPAYSYILTAIALFILVIACINYITISISRTSSRAKEVGMRKVIGADKKHLIYQFWGEALFLSFIAMLCGLLIGKLLLPFFNSLADKNLELNLFSDPTTLTAAFGLMLLTGGIAGSYPAILLARCQVVDIFHGKYKAGGKSGLGKWLVVVQFVISIILIISTLLMTKQLNFLRTKDLGFNEEQVVEIPVYETEDSEKVVEYFKNSLAPHPQILSVSGTSGGFTRFRSRSYIRTEEKNILFYHYKIDENYIETLNINITEGRNFSAKHISDATTSVLINEKLKRELEWDFAVGKSIPGQKNTIVVGVVNDYHNISLHSEIPAVVLYTDPSKKSNFILIKLDKNGIADGLKIIEDVWNQHVSNVPFSFNFLDDMINLQYQNDRKWGKIIGYSSSVAVFLACMGLFGLISLSLTKRVKEIGIRKVLGASVPGIVVILIREFTMLVLLANIFAWPLAYWAMNKWLQNFAYQVNISLWVFFLAGSLILIIALFTVSVQSVKSALANPADCLKYE